MNELELSKLLLDLILARYPDFKKPGLMKWAILIDKMIRLDKRKPGDIEAVIKWCQADAFWQNNILSTKKLRDKFDQLYLKMPKKIYEPPEPDYSPPKRTCKTFTFQEVAKKLMEDIKKRKND
jgi:hypothetical protein